jgi:ERCC4-type nuclease
MERVANALGCQYMYIIEGKLTYKKTANVARHMPFKNLITKVRHTILRGTPLVQTKDQDHTAEMIVDLARDIWRFYQSGEITFDKQIGGADAEEGAEERLTPQNYMRAIREINQKYRGAFEDDKIPTAMIDAIDLIVDENDSDDSIVQEPLDAEALVGAAEDIAEEHEVEDVETIANLNLIGVYSENTVIPQALTEQKVKSNSDILERMWIALPTVSSKSVPVLMKRFKLSDLLSATSAQVENFTNEISEMKYPSGAKIGDARAKKIMGVAYSGAAVTKLDKLKTTSMKILAEVPGITKPTAEKILEKYSLRDICSGNCSADDIAAIQKTKTRKVGQKSAEKIVELLTT